MKLILITSLFFLLAGCKSAHLISECDNRGCGDVIPPAPEIKIPISLDLE
jgi:hypothetical protein